MTTKTCSCCGNKKEVGKDKIYKCSKCGLEADRDINAAKNIRYV
jgi:putative transposase